jgi:hypothetical protein
MPVVAKDSFGKKYIFAFFSEGLLNQYNCVGTAGYCGLTDSFSVAFSLQKIVF